MRKLALVAFAALLVTIGLFAAPSAARADDAPPATPARAEEGPIAPRAARAPERKDPEDLQRRFDAREEDEDGWGWIGARFLAGFFYQQGYGLQSQSGDAFNTRAPVTERGSEEAFIVEPMALLTVRSSKKFVHQLYVPIDIVATASPDATDLVATASASNEAISLDFTSTYSATQVTDFGFRYGLHLEEQLRSFFAGPTFTFHLFEDNTVMSASAMFVADGFDPVTPQGVDHSYVARTTVSANFNLTQILSPTTVLDASAGATDQWGVLANTWNSVILYKAPGQAGEPRRVAEQFPAARGRFAFSAKLSQHIPATRSTVKGSYRFYVDENAGLAHTGELEVYQWMGPWFYMRVHGRLHTQIAPNFWAPAFYEPRKKENDFRTSDSDLETFNAQEVGVRFTLQRDKAPKTFRANDSFSLGYFHYDRTNGLTEEYVNFGYEKRF